MSQAIEVRVSGYRWALTQAHASEYNELASFSAFSEAFPMPQGDEQAALFSEWEIGVWDTNRLTREDSYLSISEVAELAGVGRQYVKDEVRKGNLPALKVGRQYSIHPDDFRKWMANPKRGSRRNNSE